MMSERSSGEGEVSPEHYRGLVAVVPYDPETQAILLTARKEDGKPAIISGKGWPKFDPTPGQGAVGEVDHEIGASSRSFRALGDGETPNWIEMGDNGEPIWVYVGLLDKSQIEPERLNTGKLRWMKTAGIDELQETDLAFEGVRIAKSFKQKLEAGVLTFLLP